MRGIWGYSRLLAAVAIAMSAPVYAQSTAEDAPVTAGILDESGAQRPNMPALFFTVEQRRLLEAVRQEFISSEDLAIDEFVPLVLRQNLVEEEEEEETNLRGRSVQINALIRNRATGQTSLWLNGEEFDLQDKSGVLGDEGLTELAPATADNGSVSVVGTDSFNLSRFVLKVGQRLSGSGEVDETYPVVIIRKN